MKIVVLGGAGIVGRVIARDLASDPGVREIVIGDLDLEGARQAAEATGRPGVAAARIDVTDHAALVRVLQGAGAVVNAVQYYLNVPVMKACLDARTHYIDLGGLFHTTREQLVLDGAFAKAGLLAIVGLGSCPGISNVQARILADSFDEIASIRIYNGGTPGAGDSLAWGYSIETILDEITKSPVVFRDGRFQEAAPLGEEELYRFQDPIGVTKVHLTLHSEVATLPLTYGPKGLKECVFKIAFFGYSEKALKELRLLADLGLASTAPIEVKGARVRPRDVLIEVLKRAPRAAGAANPGFKEIVTEARGLKDGKSVVGTITTTAGPREGWGISGGTSLVASPPAIVARWLAQGSITLAGVRPPEQAIEAAPLFRELAARGARTTVAFAETYPP